MEIEEIAKPNTSKSAGPFNIPIKILKLLRSFVKVLKLYIAIRLTLVVQSQINLRIAKVISMFKKGAHTIVSSYRPISLLLVFKASKQKENSKEADPDSTQERCCDMWCNTCKVSLNSKSQAASHWTSPKRVKKCSAPVSTTFRKDHPSFCAVCEVSGVLSLV